MSRVIDRQAVLKYGEWQGLCTLRNLRREVVSRYDRDSLAFRPPISDPCPPISLSTPPFSPAARRRHDSTCPSVPQNDAVNLSPQMHTLSVPIGLAGRARGSKKAGGGGLCLWIMSVDTEPCRVATHCKTIPCNELPPQSRTSRFPASGSSLCGFAQS